VDLEKVRKEETGGRILATKVSAERFLTPAGKRRARIMKIAFGVFLACAFAIFFKAQIQPR
jgi:hypothetical protein